MNHKRVERIWRQEGLRVPSKQPKKGRLWLNDGSCIRLRSEYRNHVWSYDFVHERTHDGRTLRILTVIDEYSRECLALRVERSFTSHKVLDTLAKLFIRHGTVASINSVRVAIPALNGLLEVGHRDSKTESGVLVQRLLSVLPSPRAFLQRRCYDVGVLGVAIESHGVKLWLFPAMNALG